MSIRGRRIRQRHLAVDLLGITLGSFLVDFVVHFNLRAGFVSLVLGGALFLLDRESIEKEEHNTDPDYSPKDNNG